MKQKLLIFITTIVMAAFMTGCNSFLDDVTPHDGTLTPSILYETESSITNAITGTVALFRDYYYDRHVTVGYRFYFLGLDFMGNDIISNPGQWWTYESAWNATIMSKNGYQTSYYWNMFYQFINDINTKIAGIEGSPVSEEFKATSIAELKALRGLSYFSLMRVFQKSYNYVDKAALSIPIYTEPTTSQTTGNPLSSVEKVYTLILEDLDEAVRVLTASRTAKHRINKNMALAFRANVYLEMHRWAEAASDAAAARAGYSLMDATTYVSGFNDLNSMNECMWGFPFQADQAWGYASLFSHVDIYRPQNGYKNFFINDEFVQLFSATDMRSVLFDYSIYYDPNDPEEIEYEQEHGVQWYKWGSHKYQDKPNVDGDYVIMRASEMLLVEAEAKAQNGDADAGDILYELQLHRDPSAVKSGNTGQALVDEILVERRKELYGEIGIGYLDLKRYDKPMVRSGNHSLGHIFTVPAGSPRWVFPIPQSELDRNPNIN